MQMQRVTSPGRHWPLHDTATTRRAERAAAATLPPHALMARAGLDAARLALVLAPHARRVQLWCGPGNNGGDGLVAARRLRDAGIDVAVALIGDAGRLPPDATDALQQALAAGVPVSADAAFDAPDLVVDALLGIGASRAPEGTLRTAIELINAGAAPVIAIDLPSGLHADTGAPLGSSAVRAMATLHCLTLKPGCFTATGRDHAGAAWLATLGVDAGPPSAWLHAGAAPRTRLHASHKGRFGDVAVVGGATGMAGAAWLAARAALAAGAGRVYCSPLDATASLLDPLQPELMGRSAWWRSPPDVLAATTIVCGCGGGGDVAAALPPLLAHAARIVLDADALNAIAADAALETQLRHRTARGLPTLLTPHPLEAARLLRCAAGDVQHDRIAAAQRLAGAFGCTVLLKGSGSITATPGRRPRINASGNAALATAGTGDVLAGWAAGLWAQQPSRAPHDLGADAAWQHGHAADRWTPAAADAPLPASALIEALRST